MIRQLLAQEFPSDTVINVNFPHVEKVDRDGSDLLTVKVVPLDYSSPKFTYRKNPKLEEESGLFLHNDFYQVETQAETDMDVVRKGMIAVSPLLVKPDEQALMDAMHGWFDQ